MSAVNVKIEGLSKFQKVLASASTITAPLFQNAIYKSIYTINRKTVPLTPVDTQHLRLSLGRGIVFAPLYGRIGSNLNYALVQHENTRFRHPRGGGAKYLERGVEASKQEITKHFTDAMNGALDDIARRSK